MYDKLAVVLVPVQDSLFELEERRYLGDGAWIEYRSGWLADADDLFEALLPGVPWHAERRQMYDRVVDVPRLVSFHDLTREDPRIRSWLSCGDDSMTSTPANSANRSPRSGSASTGMALTVWPGMATPSAGAARRTPWSRSSAWARPATSHSVPAAAAVLRCVCPWDTAICWSWVGRASVLGSIRFLRRRRPPVHG